LKNTNYVRMMEGFKNMWKKKYLILIPIMYCLIIGGLSCAGEWLLGKMGSPFSSELYLMIFYIFIMVILIIGLVGIVCMLGTPINSKKIEGELVEYINNRTPLTDPIYGHLSDFRRMNYMMSPYISKLPDYLKQIKSGITPAPVSEEVIEQLSMIVLEATEWKEAYKKVVAKYKTIHTAYKLTFYSSDGNLDFANWLK
jgi:hypothetical protein